MSLPHWFKECIQVTVEDQDQLQLEDSSNVLNFPQARTDRRTNDGQSALELVLQAAELVGNMQEEVRQRETQAQSLCRGAIEKLRLAEQRVEAAESALSLAESRLSSAEARLAAAELQAKNAETRARELDQALSSVEDAIRTRLLGETRDPDYQRRVAGLAR
jgi:hypothetical protein